MNAPSIPDKLYFKIGEVSKITQLKPYVLRYWETEFPEISPVKSRTNQRLYKRRDVELILKIRGLLYEERFTINGARKRLKVESRSKKIETPQLNLELPVKEKASKSQCEIIKSEIAQLIHDMEKQAETLEV